MPDDQRRLINSLVSAIADDAGMDWGGTKRASLQDSNLDRLRQFQVIAAIGGDVRQTKGTATVHAGSWSRAWSVLWAAIVWSAGAKGALAAWSIWHALVGAGGPIRPSAVTLLSFGLTGALLIVGGPRDARVRHLGTFFVVVASAFANPWLTYLSTGVIGAGASELRRLPFDAFLPLSLWLFVRAFPSEPKPRAVRRVADLFVVGSAAVGSLLFTANAWGAHLGAEADTALAAIVRVLDRDTPTLVYWPLLFTIAAAALPYLLWKLRFETIEAKQRGTLFITALVAGTTPMLVAVIATPFVPALRDPSMRTVVGWILFGALIAVLPSTAYAVAVQRVMDLHLILRKTIQHTLARYAIVVVSVAPLTYLFVDMYIRRSETATEFALRGHPLPLFVLPILGFGVLIFRDRLLRGVDRWFLRAAVDYGEALARIERGLRDARSVGQIAGLVTREVERAIHPAGIAVCVVDGARLQLVAVEGTCRPLSTSSVLAELLRQVRCDIQFDLEADGPISRLLPEQDREWLSDAGFTLLCPLIDSTGRLLGIVAMGPSRGGLPYTKQDRMFVTAIGSHAATRLEHRWLQELSGDGRERSQPNEGVAIDWDNELAARCPACGTMWPGNVRRCSCRTPTVPAALPIVVKDKFRVERLLGSGGMGVVYLAVDVTLDRKVAIKTLPFVTPDRVAWLQREARAMASVVHPNLAMIYGAEQWRGTPLLIVEYLEGGTLADYLRSGPLDVAEVIDLGIVLADVLDRVHASGVLHRDIKPSNIAYTRDGIAKLLDFGVSAIVDQSMSEDGLPLPREPDVRGETLEPIRPPPLATSSQYLIGTPLYLSPEALAGEVPHPSCDLWSLSLVLYEALAAHHPFASENVDQVMKKIREVQIPDVRDFRPDCPPDLAALLRDSLSPLLIRRPSTAAELRGRLQQLRAHLALAEP